MNLKQRISGPQKLNFFLSHLKSPLEYMNKAIELRSHRFKNRHKNLMEILIRFPDFGKGMTIRKKKKHGFETYIVDKVFPSLDGRHGKVFAQRFWHNFPLDPKPRMLTHVYRDEWRYLPPEKAVLKKEKHEKEVERKQKLKLHWEQLEKYRPSIHNEEGKGCTNL